MSELQTNRYRYQSYFDFLRVTKAVGIGGGGREGEEVVVGSRRRSNRRCG